MLELLAIFLCLVLNAGLAAVEMAFVTVNDAALRRQATSGDRTATYLLSLRDKPERTLSLLQIGITLVGLLGAAVGGAGAAEQLAPELERAMGISEALAGALAIGLVVIPLAALNVVFAELLPKALGLRNSMRVLRLTAGWLASFERMMSPIASALEGLTKVLLRAVTRRLPPRPAPGPEVALEERFTLNVARLGRKLAGDICVPWAQVVTVSLRACPSEVALVVYRSGHTRIPVVDEERDGIAGVLHTKEFLAYRETTDMPDEIQGAWRPVVRPALSVRASDSALAVLAQMQGRHSHLAVVYDAEGRRQGIVTLVDIVEQIIGDIYDEDDDGRLRRLLSASAKQRVLGITTDKSANL